jgi:hypothetical protein
MMDCEEFRSKMSEILEGDLEAGDMEAAENHEAGCSGCSAEMRRFRSMVQEVEDLPDPVPEDTVRFEILDGLTPRSEVQAIPEIMDVDDLRKYLGATEKELEEEIGNLPAFEFAGRLKFKKEHIDRWIEERERERARSIEMARAGTWLKRWNAG